MDVWASWLLGEGIFLYLVHLRRFIVRNIFLASVLLTAGLAEAQPVERKSSPAPKDAGAPSATPGRPSQPAVGQALAVPAAQVLLMMVRTALVALDQANWTNNYTVLRALGAPELQKHSAEELSQAFAGIRNGGINLSPVAVATPELSEPPQITPQGLLNLVGYFPTEPLQIHFQITYKAVKGKWKIFGLNVTASPPATP